MHNFELATYYAIKWEMLFASSSKKAMKKSNKIVQYRRNNEKKTVPLNQKLAILSLYFGDILSFVYAYFLND